MYFTADTGTGSDSVVIVFGTPDRSALIWGVTFHPEQFAERHPGGLNIQISYNYYKGGEHAFCFYQPIVWYPFLPDHTKDASEPVLCS